MKSVGVSRLLGERRVPGLGASRADRSDNRVIEPWDKFGALEGLYWEEGVDCTRGCPAVGTSVCQVEVDGWEVPGSM